MEWDFVNEVGRKLIHLLILLVLIGYFLIKNSLGQQVALVSLVALLIIFLISEFFRLELGWKMPFFSAFIRPKEQNRMFGVIYFISATVICLAVFDPIIALSALLMTTFGDLMAALIGKRYGTTLIFRNKTIVGFIAGLITNITVAMAMAFIFSINFYVLFVMALVATVVEILSDELDDNLMVPIFSGFVGQIITFML